jgi:hypothetical protein
MSNKTYSVPEFALKVNRSRASVARACLLGLIPCERVPGPGRQQWRIPAAALAIYKPAK